MANQPESSTWATGVYQWEATDPAQGGLGGVMNTPILQLASRTRYLKDQVDALSTSVSGFAPLTNPAFLGNPTAPTAPQFDNDTSIANTAFVQRALGNLAGLDSYNTSVTLSASQVGKIIEYYGSSDGTCVLPLSSACPPGATLLIANVSGMSLTVSRQSADVLLGVNGATSIVLGGNDTIQLTNVGSSTNQWIVSGGSVVSRYSYSGSLKASTSGTYGGMSVGYATSAGNAGTVGGWSADDLRSFPNVLNRPTVLAGYGITDAVEKGTGTGQGANAVKIGWGSGILRVQVDGTDFAGTWPISVSGNAATVTGLSSSPGASSSHSLPGGELEKSGVYYIGDVTSGPHLYTVTFPVAFPNACDNVQISLQDTLAGPAVAVDFRLVNYAQGNFIVQVMEHGDATQNLSIHWTAKGR